MKKSPKSNRHPQTSEGSPPWPKPAPLENRYPFYGVLGDIVRTVSPQSESDPMGLLAQLLVGIASVIGHGPHFRVEATSHHVNLFASIVGASSRARKGTAQDWALRILTEVDEPWSTNCQSTGLSSGEGLIWSLRDSVQEQVDGEAVTTDAGVEDKRLLVKEPELATVLRVLRRGGNTLSPTLRSLWDSGCAATMTKKKPAKVTNAHLCVVAHITHGELVGNFKGETTNGLGNRILWFAVKKSKCLPFGGEYPAEQLEPLIDRLRDAVAFAKEVGEMKRSNKADKLWGKAYRRLDCEHPERSERVNALHGRNHAQVMRVACIFALLDKKRKIQWRHLKAALAVWDYVAASIDRIFGGGSSLPGRTQKGAL